MTAQTDPVRQSYDAIHRKGRGAIERGDLEGALRLFEQAISVAAGLGDRELEDRALCSRSSVAIELGETQGVVTALRAVLGRNTGAEVCHLAAYQIARVYELQKEFKKALFYARIARDRASEVGRPDWTAFCHNQVGNILLAESFVGPASAEFERALALMPSGESVPRARVLDNLGYCRILQRHRREGFRLLYESLRALRRVGADRYTISTHLDLAFAHLEVERFRNAERHAGRALALAERFGETDSRKNALYLLGEAALLAGDTQRARRTFARLQEYFPDTPFLTDFLLAVDVRRVINLKA